jgi:hypothetical protein
MEAKMNKPVYKTCKKCKRIYTLGVDGIKDYCDECAKIKRDDEGYIKDDDYGGHA